MNTAAIKLGFFAVDQIAKWVALAVKARGNPNMTDAEADQLIADVNADAVNISDGWRAYRAGK